MSPEQITQLLTIIGTLVTTINAVILFYIANHQRVVAKNLKQYNGTVLEAINSIKPPRE